MLGNKQSALARPFIFKPFKPFTNRQRNKIKCVMWEDNGFVMYYKALAEEKFKWPKPADELLALTGEQINWLLDGYDISLFKGHKILHYESVG